MELVFFPVDDNVTFSVVGDSNVDLTGIIIAALEEGEEEEGEEEEEEENEEAGEENEEEEESTPMCREGLMMLRVVDLRALLQSRGLTIGVGSWRKSHA